MRALTEVTLKSLKENREIRQKLGGENYQQCAGIPTVTTTCVQSVLENLYMQKTFDKRKCKDGDVINSKIQRKNCASVRFMYVWFYKHATFREAL